jgi:hypothetical protein
MSLTNSLLLLSKTCVDIISDLDKESITFDKNIKTSIQDCKSLLQIVNKSDAKKVRLVARLEPFFKEHYESFCKPYYVYEGDSKVPDTTFYSALDKTKSDNGFRGLCVVPNERDNTVCVPFGEMFELAIDLDERNHDEYGMYVPRLVHRLLSAMSTFEVEDNDTDGIDLIIAKLEDDAAISDLDIGLPGMNIDADAARNIMKDFGSSDQMNELIGSVGGIIDKVKGGGLAGILSSLSGGGGDDLPMTDPDDQE